MSPHIKLFLEVCFGCFEMPLVPFYFYRKWEAHTYVKSVVETKKLCRVKFVFFKNFLSLASIFPVSLAYVFYIHYSSVQFIELILGEWNTKRLVDDTKPKFALLYGSVSRLVHWRCLQSFRKAVLASFYNSTWFNCDRGCKVVIQEVEIIGYKC